MLRKSQKKRRGNGKPFKKGDPRAGRPKGSQNKATKEIRELARTFLEDEQGKKMLLEQYRAGVLAPATLSMMHYYAYGKPKETVEHSLDDDTKDIFTEGAEAFTRGIAGLAARATKGRASQED